jgi:hypothetical protein
VNPTPYAVVSLDFHPFGFAAANQILKNTVDQMLLIYPHIAITEEIVLE